MSAQRTVQILKGQEPSNPNNAERDMQTLFTHLGLSLPIPIQSMEHRCEDSDTKIVKTFHIKPEDWIQYWMNTQPNLLGGHHGDAFENFHAFWKVYELQHGDHNVFTEHRNRLHRVVPLLLHGDEGRAVKRSNYLVMSMETPFGSVPDNTLKGCSCHEELAARPDWPSYGSDSGSLPPEILQVARGQLTNYKGHSYLSRWLLFGAGGWLYKKHPHIVDVVTEEIVASLISLFYQGVMTNDGQPIFAAVCHIKGDMDFHKKMMRLTRCYANLGRVAEIEICHHCKAGGPTCKFEDYQDEPQWANTMYLNRPWDTDDVPPLSKLPYNASCPEKLLAGDLFHIHKLGIGRDVVGGVLIVLLRKGFFDYEGSSTNIVDRFNRSYNMFSLWCKVEKKTPGLRSFSKSFFNMKNLASAPWSNSKGSDTILLLGWLEFTLKLNLQNPVVPGHHQLLGQMLQVCTACLKLRMVHHHKLWLERDCARRLYIAMMSVLRGYVVLGRKSLEMKIRAFIQKPKLHGLHHLAYFLLSRLKSGDSLIPNPQWTACEMNEDFLGRISRLSRRVGFRLVDLRVGQRYFLKVKALINNRMKSRLSHQRIRLSKCRKKR